MQEEERPSGEGESILDSDVDVNDPISEVARQRRIEAERESAEPRPDFVVAVEQSEVSYTLDPVAMPFRNLDPVVLAEELRDQYGLSLGKVDYSPLLASMPVEQLTALSQEEALRRLVRAPDGSIDFEAGKYRLRSDFVPIRQVSVNYESVLVSVAGVTGVAKVIAQDVIEIMWKIAGSIKRWDQDIQPMVLMQGFGTATRVQLAEGAERLLNPSLLAAVSDEVGEGGQLAKRMGAYKPGRAASPVVSSAFFDDLVLRVARYEPSTGASSTHRVSVQVTARNDYGTGRLRIISELDYDDHIALVRRIVEGMT